MTKLNSPFLRRCRHRGFTMIEVLVALAVLSIGLLGLAALQITSLSFNTNSYLRTQATVAAYDIIDRIRSNRTGFAANEYHVPTAADAGTKLSDYATCGATCDCQTSSCSVSNLALFDLARWYELTDSQLPGALGSNRPTITRDPVTNEVTIMINWVEKDVSQSKSWTVLP